MNTLLATESWRTPDSLGQGLLLSTLKSSISTIQIERISQSMDKEGTKEEAEALVGE